MLSGARDALRRAPSYAPSRDAPARQSLRRAARPALAAALAEDWAGPVLLITAQPARAREWEAQLPGWSDADILRFASPNARPYERVNRDGPSTQRRLATLFALQRADDAPAPSAAILIASASALMTPTLPPERYRAAILSLAQGQRHSLRAMLQNLHGIGYVASPLVVAEGQFARRGGILDVFPLAAAQPLRIEWDGEEIASLRLFDPVHQRSTGQTLTAAQIPPAREFLPADGPPIAQELALWLEQNDLTAADALATAQPCPTLEFYLPYLGPPASLLDHLPANARLFIEDPEELRAQFAQIEREAQQRSADATLPPAYPVPYLSGETLLRRANQFPTLSFLSGDVPDSRSDFTRAPPRFSGNLQDLRRWCRDRCAEKAAVVLATASAARLAELWYEEEGYLATETELTDVPRPGSLRLVQGSLAAGWSLPGDAGAHPALHLLSDAEIFGWSRPPRRRPRPRSTRSRLSDLQPGALVVHEDYGIGRFIGTQQRRLAGIRREFLRINYAGEDALFVPIHHADRVTRYVGAEGREPTLSALGKRTEWERARQRASASAWEEARDLLQIAAARARAPGIATSADSPWQHELEARFPYEETPDQRRSLHEIKTDLERPQSMDRLLCGDVGFGKTEVALRAAFKVVMDGRQVAFLVPTTVLAQQHLQTFRYRLAPFPVRVELLSRFHDRETQKQLLEALRSGEIDILIGTHRLLSADVDFARLGLLIIDDEQRFGVRHKEHFKRLRAQLDVLTMTATPIPRTLFLALSGVRDISQMRSPPEERLPVLTHTGRYDEALVRQVILREIERGGQVFCIHNRVRTIETARERLERLIPEARITVAHGQLPQNQLASLMAAFARGESDMLLSTTIVEAGLDIPNANTLIVERADRFGLAQLYQLRGRVGRGPQQAYAYFFHPDPARLRPDARERLLTIAEHSELGSGWQVALRDLELRGGGGILSTRQSGHVAAIGLHLYTRLLAEALHGARQATQDGAAPSTQAASPATKAEATASADAALILDLPLPAFLPEEYLPALEQRLEIYRRIGNLNALEEIAALREELRDRFGPPPPPVEGLLFQMSAKLLAQRIGARALRSQGDELALQLPALSLLDRAALAARLAPLKVRVTRPALRLALDEGDEWRAALLALLHTLAEDEAYAQARARLRQQTDRERGAEKEELQDRLIAK
ncbi:MAG: transcription-repair coupling factor [Chloroflexi bacterium]|nr:transcription-repair coupling factor [Chloroflexota bacterium]